MTNTHQSLILCEQIVSNIESQKRIEQHHQDKLLSMCDSIVSYIECKHNIIQHINNCIKEALDLYEFVW